MGAAHSASELHREEHPDGFMRGRFARPFSVPSLTKLPAALPPVPTSNVHMANRLTSQQVSLRVHSVKCIDENNGAWVERIGNDEIWLCGYSISATGDTAVIAP